MGTFEYSFEIASSINGPFERVNALVDTGATYTWIPASILKKLNLKPVEKVEFDTADGRVISRDIGDAVIRLNGRTRPTPVVFGDDNSTALIGAVTLEIFGLGVDPLGKRLVPVRAMLKGFRTG